MSRTGIRDLDAPHAAARPARAGALGLALWLALAPGTSLGQKSAGQMLDDSTISATVKAELVGSSIAKAAQVNVETYKSVVQLSGFVDSEAARDEAGRLAAAVDGVREVRNSIVVAARPSVGQRIEDGLITGRVKAALIDDKGVSSNQINVETRAGVVQMSGFVASEQRRARAELVAARVEGVLRVENALVVRPD